MTTFLEEIAAQTVKDEKSLANTVYILPSKRAGTFLRKYISKTLDKTSFAPTIYSIESFVEKLSGLTFATTTHQLFVLYEAYLQTFPGEKDDFYTFTKWGEEQTAKYTEELYKTISSITTQILENPAVVCQKLSKAENQGGMSYFIVLSINQFLLYVFCTKAWIMDGI